MQNNKAVLLIVDGLGGRPSDMDGKTCLEAADTPNLDKMSSEGINGLLNSIKRGVRPGSDTAHLSLFGYDPEEVYSGRGIFEALGYGLEAEEGSIYFRTNFATVTEDNIIKDRRAGRIGEGQKELEEAINDIELEGADFTFRATNQHRGALVLKGEDLSSEITETDPHETGVSMKKCKPTDDNKRTADVVNQFVEKSREALRGLEINRKRKDEGKPPANTLLLRGASEAVEVESLKEKYGIDSTCIGAGPLYLGVARQVGMEIKTPEGATGGLDSDLMAKVEAAEEELKEKDFVFIHMKGADNAAHDHDASAKKKFLEKVDEAVGYLLDNLDWNRTHMVFTGDHTTPVKYGDHTAEPVPITFYGPEVREDNVNRIGERPSAKGDVGHIEGLDVLPVLFNYNNWLEKFGA